MSPDLSSRSPITLLMLSFILAGAASAVIGVLSGQGCLLMMRRDTGRHLQTTAKALEERVMERVQKVIAQESTDRNMALNRTLEAEENIAGMVGRFATHEELQGASKRFKEEIEAAMRVLITRNELELALQGMAQAQAQAQQLGQLARREEVFGVQPRPAMVGNQSELLDVLQALGGQVADINRQLGI